MRKNIIDIYLYFCKEGGSSLAYTLFVIVIFLNCKCNWTLNKTFHSGYNYKECARCVQ